METVKQRGLWSGQGKLSSQVYFVCSLVDQSDIKLSLYGYYVVFLVDTPGIHDIWTIEWIWPWRSTSTNPKNNDDLNPLCRRCSPSLHNAESGCRTHGGNTCWAQYGCANSREWTFYSKRWRPPSCCPSSIWYWNVYFQAWSNNKGRSVD